MKKIVCIALMVICVVGVATAQKYKTRAATKKEQKAFPAKDYITTKYDVSGLFTKTMTITMENSSPVIAYVGVTLRVTFYDAGGTKIIAENIIYNDPIFPKKSVVVNAPFEIPKTAQTAKVEVTGGKLVFATLEESEPKIINREWY